MVQMQATKYNSRTAYKHRDSATGEWIATSWTDFAKKVKTVAKAFVALGINEQENLATCTQNCPEGILTDFAAYSNRAVIVPLYATSSVSQIVYILNEAEVKFLFVGEQAQYDCAIEAMPQCAALKQLIIYDKKVVKHASDTTSIYFDELFAMGESAKHRATVEARMTAVCDEDLANIIYTSGTTGEPKGVMLTHENFNTAMRIHKKRLTTLSDKDSSMCFLPLAHIFERAWTYFCFTMGIEVYINLEPKDVQQSLIEVKPTLMCSVPRFWEKVYAAVQEKVTSAKGLQSLLIKRALIVGRKHNFDYAHRGLTAPWRVRFAYSIYDKLLFVKVRRAAGLDNGRLFPVAGAALSDGINEFLHCCGINITYGYGLTETTATVTCFNEDYELGTVGVTMPGVQIKIGEDNEILIKGATVMKGYYKKPAETAKVLSEDGWFSSGDAGKIMPDGSLVLTDRIKDLFKTSNGKYIAPQALETKVGEDKFIDQVAVIGNGRKYVTAIIIPAYEALKEYAAQQQIKYRNMEELLKNQRIQQMMQERIDELQKNFARFEQIKKFTLLAKAFSMESGELTNTLKLRRPIINQLYSREIEAMYV